MSSRRSLRNSADSADGDDAPTPAEILESARGHGPNSDTETGSNADASTERGRQICVAFVNEYLDTVGDERIVSSKQIRASLSLDEPVRPQVIGKALGSRMAGNTPDDFLNCVEIDTWADSHPTKWVLTRVSDEDPGSVIDYTHVPSSPRNKIDFVREIESATGIDPSGRSIREHGRNVPRVRIDIAWMRDVLKATIEKKLGVDIVAEIRECSKQECLMTLARILDTEITGSHTHMSKATLRGLYDYHVRDCDPSEVEL